MFYFFQLLSCMSVSWCMACMVTCFRVLFVVIVVDRVKWQETHIHKFSMHSFENGARWMISRSFDMVVCERCNSNVHKSFVRLLLDTSKCIFCLSFNNNKNNQFHEHIQATTRAKREREKKIWLNQWLSVKWSVYILHYALHLVYGMFALSGTWMCWFEC